MRNSNLTRWTSQSPRTLSVGPHVYQAPFAFLARGVAHVRLPRTISLYLSDWASIGEDSQRKNECERDDVGMHIEDDTLVKDAG